MAPHTHFDRRSRFSLWLQCMQLYMGDEAKNGQGKPERLFLPPYLDSEERIMAFRLGRESFLYPNCAPI